MAWIVHSRNHVGHAGGVATGPHFVGANDVYAFQDGYRFGGHAAVRAVAHGCVFAISADHPAHERLPGNARQQGIT